MHLIFFPEVPAAKHYVAFFTGLICNRLPDSLDIASDTIAWLAAERREWLGGRYVKCPWVMEELLG